jgi:hypothetical protein
MSDGGRRPGVKTSVYLPADDHAAWTASGLPLAEVVRAGLAALASPPVDESALRAVLRQELAALPLGADCAPGQTSRCESCGGDLACPRCYTDENACA